MARPSESGSSAEDVVEWVREASSRLHDLELQCRHLTALCNTLQLRLDAVEADLNQVKGQLAGEYGVTLPARVDALSKVLTEVISVCNRVEPEVLKLLRWREALYLGHPRLDLEALD